MFLFKISEKTAEIAKIMNLRWKIKRVKTSEIKLIKVNMTEFKYDTIYWIYNKYNKWILL